MDDELSRNKKNTATDSKETILTDRFGCFARTLEARSCTDNETAIRRVMSTNTVPKESRPDSVAESLGGGKGEDCEDDEDGFLSESPNALHSFELRASCAASFNIRGRALNTMLSISTHAMSSSSEICASCAASSSSRPIPNETLKARSDPKEPKAVPVSAIAPLDEEGTEVVYQSAIDAALRESYHLPPRLAWQAPSNGGAFLFLRRLLVAPRGIKRGDGAGGPVRMRRNHYTHKAQHYGDGMVFGCTLGNLMHHCRNPAHKRPLMHAMYTLRRVLVPAGRALATCSGEDARLLVRGMCCHRVLAAQGKRLRELKHAPAIDSKTGHVGVVLGISAALLIVFECITHTPEHCEGLRAELSSCLREAQAALVGWRFPDVDDEDMHVARAAEVRAIERARLAVARAQTTGKALSDAASVRLQLDCYRRAVWPHGEELSAEHHALLLERIQSGELVDLEPDAEVRGSAPPGITGLSALPSLGSADGSSDEAASSTGSSWSSWASSVESETGALPMIECAMHRIAEALQQHVLTPEAQQVLARPVTISSTPTPEGSSPMIQ